MCRLVLTPSIMPDHEPICNPMNQQFSFYPRIVGRTPVVSAWFPGLWPGVVGDSTQKRAGDLPHNGQNENCCP